MARAGNLDFAGTARASADERGELAGDGALTKHAVGHFEQGVELEPEARKRAKHGVQMGHQHRRGNSLAAHVAQQKNQFRILARSLDEVAIVAADDSRRPVKVVHPPVADVDVGLRQQSPLHARRKLEIPFECALLFAGQVIQAETREGIGKQAVLLDRIVADVAEPVAAAVHAAERPFDVVEKLEKRRGLGSIGGHGNRRDRNFQAVAPLFELLSEVGIADCVHGLSFHGRSSRQLGCHAIRFWHGIFPLFADAHWIHRNPAAIQQGWVQAGNLRICVPGARGVARSGSIARDTQRPR